MTREEAEAALMAAVDTCRCGHVFEYHDGHTITVGEPGRFHCAGSDGCRIFRTDPNAVLAAYRQGVIAELKACDDAVAYSLRPKPN